MAVISEKEIELIKIISDERLKEGKKLEYEELDGYEFPSRMKFSLVNKPCITIKTGKLCFNMACVRTFEAMHYVFPVFNREKGRLAVIPSINEDLGTVWWSRNDKNDKLVNREISSPKFVSEIYESMNWSNEKRYKVIGQLLNSSEGLILVFDLNEALEISSGEEYTDETTGKIKHVVVETYADEKSGKHGKTYEEFKEYRQMNMFEDLKGLFNVKEMEKVMMISSDQDEDGT